MKRIVFQKKSNWKIEFLKALLILVILPAIPFAGIKQLQIKIAQAEELKVQVQILESSSSATLKENEALKEKLAASVKVQAPENIKALSRYYIKKYFGKDAAKVEKVMICESGLSNQTIHVNRPGLGADYGLYQINDKWHKERFEKMYNVPFEIGSHDWDLSSKYAKYLYDHSGLNPWVCSKLVALGGEQ